MVIGQGVNVFGCGEDGLCRGLLSGGYWKVMCGGCVGCLRVTWGWFRCMVMGLLEGC